MTTQKPACLWFDELSTQETAQAAKDGKVIIFPLGSVEEHGAHLPLCTDSIQPEYIALEVAKKTGCLVAPSIRYGICNATRNFPGTLTIQFDTLYRLAHDVLSELVRNGFKKIIVMSGHAGNSHMVALRLAAQDIAVANDGQGVRILVLSDLILLWINCLSKRCLRWACWHIGDFTVLAIKPELSNAKVVAAVWNMPVSRWLRIRSWVFQRSQRCPTKALLRKEKKSPLIIEK
jgi:hypothetical protein